MTDHENLTVRLWDVIHDARSTPSGHAPTSAIVAAVLPIVAGEVRAASVVEAMLTAALTPEPERPDGAEEIEAVLREEWTFSDEDGGGDAFGDLAQRLASRGVRVVGEEDR